MVSRREQSSNAMLLHKMGMGEMDRGRDCMPYGMKLECLM